MGRRRRAVDFIGCSACSGGESCGNGERKVSEVRVRCLLRDGLAGLGAGKSVSASLFLASSHDASCERLAPDGPMSTIPVADIVTLLARF